jgi:hypothetical protein
MAYPMTAPQSGAGGLDANARGIIVLVVAVVVGFLLLLNAGASGNGGGTVAAEDTSTTIDVSGLGDDPEEEPSDPTTPDDTAVETTPEDTTAGNRPPAEVSVLVLNIPGGVVGAAGAGTETLSGAGYQMAEPANANSADVEATTIYFAEGFEQDAVSVASVLGRAADAVAPMPEEPLGPGAEEADVVVVLGPDAAPVGE